MSAIDLDLLSPETRERIRADLAQQLVRVTQACAALNITAADAALTPAKPTCPAAPVEAPSQTMPRRAKGRPLGSGRVAKSPVMTDDEFVAAVRAALRGVGKMRARDLGIALNAGSAGWVHNKLRRAEDRGALVVETVPRGPGETSPHVWVSLPRTKLKPCTTLTTKTAEECERDILSATADEAPHTLSYILASAGIPQGGENFHRVSTMVERGLLRRDRIDGVTMFAITDAGLNLLTQPTPLAKATG